MRIAVTVEWDGEEYKGEASGAALPRARLETTAVATLRAIERVIVAQLGEGERTLSSTSGVEPENPCGAEVFCSYWNWNSNY